MSNKLSLIVNFIGVDKMSGAMRNIVGLGQRGSASLRGLNGEARRLGRELRDVERDLSRSSGNVTELANRERELERALAGVNRQLERQRRSAAIAADARAMAARGQELQNKGRDNVMGGVALAAPFVLATKAAAEFGSGMVDIQQKAELSDQATDRLANRIVVMAKAARQLPEDMRVGLDLLLGRGLSIDFASQVIGPAGRLSTAYKVELPDAAGAAYASINNLKVQARDTAKIFDAMAAAGNAGGFEVKDMARNFPVLTAQMQALGDIGIPAVADLSAALQVAMNTAGDADQAANNIANLLGKINAPGTIRAFKKNFGIDLPAAMKKLTDSGHSSLEAIAMITEQAIKGDTKKLGFAFEDTQARNGLLALIQGMKQYRDIRAAALNSGGTVDKAFNQRVARDATVNWRAFLGTASTLAITLGATLLPVMTDVLGQVGAAASAFGAWAQANPQLASALTRGAAALVLFKIGLGSLQFLFGGLLGPLGRTIAFMRTAAPVFGALRTAALFLARGVLQAGMMMLANPIVLAITAIVLALGAAGYLIYRNWDRIKAAFNSGLAYVRGLLSSAGAWMSSIGRQMMNGLLLALNPAALARKLLEVARSGITAFKNFFGIKSPSRLFMAMGGHLTQGLALGIDRGGKAPVGSMRRVGGNVTAAASFGGPPIGRRPRGAGLGGPGPASGPISVHVYGAPGQSVRELAREVVREIDRAKGVQRRSSYEEAA
ncbi:phage tail tape measure protein [Sphingomonas psychrotolerans]|uniref:Phage tail tape measure protein n=1 Tax=Sphingomonas psychrotolerans TaxID=1327635 RepID=A0ABU3N3A8_9SPHN|nr:phage tail tape measure protein [Sphingomonas psychrotolerans]MDT8758252.1 phage tail tape measure protein [Sphingomonas psychrotolerans]